LSQISTIAGKFDDKTGSFTNTAAYQRAAHQPVTAPDLETAKQITPQLIPGPIGSALDAMTSIPGEDTFCKYLLDPKINAALNLGSIAFKVSTDEFGGQVVLQAAEGALAIAVGSKIVKALAINAVMNYGNLAFAGHQSPQQWGNMMGAGSKVLAAGSCAKDGCHKLTAAEHQTLAMAIESDHHNAEAKQSIAYRIFNPQNPYSPTAMALDKVPTSPGAMVAKTSMFFGTVFNITSFSKTLRQNLDNLLRPANSLAADGSTVENNTYGIPDYGFTDAELHRWSIRENATYVDARKDKYQKYYDTCIKPDLGKVIAKPDPACSSDDADLPRFRLYTLDRRVTHDLLLRYNTQTGHK
jgi:hypothetical protein